MEFAHLLKEARNNKINATLELARVERDFALAKARAETRIVADLVEIGQLGKNETDRARQLIVGLDDLTNMSVYKSTLEELEEARRNHLFACAELDNLLDARRDFENSLRQAESNRE